MVAKQPTYSYLTGHDHVGTDNPKLSPNTEKVAIGIDLKGYRKIEISEKDPGFGRFMTGPVCSSIFI